MLRMKTNRLASPIRISIALQLLCAPIAIYAAAPQATAQQSEITALRAELTRLEARIAQLESETAASSAAAPEPPSAKVETSAGPGLALASEAGSFSIGGRIHYDAYAQQTDQRPSTGGSEFRRTRFNLDGKAADWGYRLQLELSGRDVDLRDAYLERNVGASLLTVGQFKPYRAMDELTSSNDTTLMERAGTSGSGLFSGRQWQQGLGLLTPFSRGGIGASVFSIREDNTARNEGVGIAVRASWAPVKGQDRVTHLALWASDERGGSGTPAFEILAAYGGRRGPNALISQSAAGDAFSQRSIGLEFAGHLGPFYWQSEYARAQLALNQGEAELEAAYLQGSYIFGSGRRSYKTTKGVFGAMGGASGQWELAARFDQLSRIDVQNIATRRLVLGLNHYLSEEVRLMLNWTHGKDRATGDAPRQFGFRAQYVF